jgi:hypothetical protein
MLTLALVGLFAVLAGCSQYAQYSERRDGIAPTAGNAVATNEITQMVDPWPRHSANRNIAFSGTRMESAVTRYRTNTVYQPSGIGTSGTYQAQPAAAQNNTTPVGPTVTAPAAPVK